MSTRRFIVLLVGAWIGGSLFMFAVATHNLNSADALLASPPQAAAKMIDALGPESARSLLRYQASELNRYYFENWGLVQMALGAGVFGLLLFATHEGKWPVSVSLVMWLTVAVMRFILTPDLVNYGRQLDFVPRQSVTGEYARFAAVHRAYGIAEVIKLCLAAALLGMLRRSKRARRTVRNVHNVDDANNRHVDR